VRFVCDVMLGKLAKYLRLLGLDAVYLRDISELKQMNESRESLILLTRRTKPAAPVRSVVVHSDVARRQLTELKDLIGTWVDRSKVLNRCVECNVPLEDIEKSEVEHRVPEFVFHHYSTFKKCPSCKRIYWEGSHARHMSDLLKELLD
jgi:uncharacterized protein